MTRRLIYLGVVVALFVGADLAARGFVEAAVSSRAQQRAPEGSRASASIRGFPFIPRLLFGGEIKRAGVHVENLAAGGLVFAELDLDLSGVKLDRGKMLDERKARITSIDHGRFTAIVTGAALSQALGGVPVKMAGSRMSVEVAGREIPVAPRVTASGELVLGENGRGLRIPNSDFIPCVSDVVVEEGRMRLSCEFDEIPAALVDAVEDVGV